VASRVVGRSDETMDAVTGQSAKCRGADARIRRRFSRHDADAEPRDRLELGMGGSIMFDHYGETGSGLNTGDMRHEAGEASEPGRLDGTVTTQLH